MGLQKVYTLYMHGLRTVAWVTEGSTGVTNGMVKCRVTEGYVSGYYRMLSVEIAEWLLYPAV